jgi:hypothetical protein
MDFRTPDRSRYQDPRPVRRPPLAVVPPPPKAEAEAPEKQAAKKRRLRKPAAPSNNWRKIIISLVLAAVIAWLAYGYITTKNQLEQTKSPTGQGLTETQRLVNKVSLLVDLPPGETPTIASVNDASKLKNQAFFANAKDGDKVLIYSKAGKAVLYRPSTNRVIDYSTVNLGGSAAQ